MVKDRFKELQLICKNNNLPIYNEQANGVTIAIDGSEAILLELLDKIGPLYTCIKDLNLDVTELRKRQNQPDSKEKLGQKIEDIKAEAKSLYRAIQEVNGYASSEYHLISHVARTHHLALVAFFSLANTELINLQSDIHERHKNYIKKELQITGQEVDDNEIENLLGNVVFTKNFLEDTRIAKQQLFDIQQRHDEITKIESSIIEVNALFQELAVLVKQQGESIDRIEDHVYEAKEKVEQSKGELVSARMNQAKARKKKFIIIGIVVAVVAILITIIILSF